MNSRFLLIVFLTALFASSAGAGLPSHDSQGEPLPSLAPMLKEVTPAVVNIATRTRVQVSDNPLLNDPFFRRFFGLRPRQPQQRSQPQSLGSGVIIDAQQGYALTNSHVIEKAHEISVTLRDGRTLEAELIGADPAADVAVIKIPADNLTAIKMTDSDKLEVGDFVVAIGNPFGLGQTVTSGIVSALGRSGLGIEGYEDFIQTDASINPGNSGGALVNLRGELVGINTAIVAPGGGNVGIGFAIPTNMATNLMEQLLEYGEVRRGRLGVATQDLSPRLAAAFGLENANGAVISYIEPGSSADNAGLQVGDVIIEMDGRAIKNSQTLRNTLGLLRTGIGSDAVIIRDGEHKNIKFTLKDPRKERFEAGALDKRLEGLRLGPIPPGTSKIDGLEIREVAIGSHAWRVGLKPGDIITSVNRRAVNSRKSLEQALRYSGRDGVLVNISRNGRAMFVVM